MRLPVALYVPNLLGYARILLAFAGLHYAATCPVAAVGLWIASSWLDLFDGILARVLRQTSSLGVFLDVAADNILRTVVWVAVAMAWSHPPGIVDPDAAVSVAESYPSTSRGDNMTFVVPCCCCAIICLEWTTMVATQVHSAQNSHHWKEARQNDPWIIRTFFAANFRNPLGFLGIYGLFAANLFAYGCRHPILHGYIPFYDAFMYIAFLGRLLSATIEIYFCAGYITFLIEIDEQQKRE